MRKGGGGRCALVFDVIARSGSDVAIRILYAGSVFGGRKKRERIATPVCGLVRNDRRRNE